MYGIDRKVNPTPSKIDLHCSVTWSGVIVVINLFDLLHNLVFVFLTLRSFFLALDPAVVGIDPNPQLLQKPQQSKLFLTSSRLKSNDLMLYIFRKSQPARRFPMSSSSWIIHYP